MSAKILSGSEIIDRVKNEKIKISYYCIDANSSEKKQHIVNYNFTPGAVQSAAWHYFLRCIEEDSLKLTVGPYAMVENRTIFRFVWDLFFGRKFDKKRNSQNIFNLFDKKELFLYPNENILIGSNECQYFGQFLKTASHEQ